ncbi:FAD-binding oxidoreductase [Hwanghaeella grinnelliae]|uniref:FAD-binding oxidoreductase n=1 Tax=Hwanghaeella grinnelliae TaxID=2500179 RepID=A0A3S2VNE1_9PROT|nr:FAD-binding oxidoreductase [Hwanghaeella grinnelliae]RVU35023.1 FAD-binding oxidoreductase [Hwanghaeella grinnelliae]
MTIDIQGFDQSLWSATAITPVEFPSLQGEHRTDVAIVGGGFTGLSTALHLAERGISVTVLEAKTPGFGASGRNGGQVIAGFKHNEVPTGPGIDGDLAARMDRFGDGTAQFTFDLIARLGIDCGAKQGGWAQGAHGDVALQAIERKAAVLGKRGVSLEILSAAETERRLGTNWYPGSLWDPRGGTLQPLSYARGLAAAASHAGASIFTESPVTAVARDGKGWKLTTASGASVTAEKALFCTNGYSDRFNPIPSLSKTVIPFFSYQIATAPLSDNILKTLLADGVGVSEFRRLLAYFRVDSEGRFIMGARGASDGSMEDPSFDFARARIKQLFPALADQKMEYFWNGKVAITMDYLPRLIEQEYGLYAAVGWNGRGVAVTTASGPVLADWMTGTAPKDLPLPVTPPRPIGFHGFKRKVSSVVALWYDHLDKKERTPSAA